MTAPLPLWRALIPVIAFSVLSLACYLWPLRRLRTVLLCCVLTILYAVLQDQVSARLCPEYFTIGHPPIPGLAKSTLLGLCWGFLAGFPGGLALGIPLAFAANFGPRRKVEVRELLKPVLSTLAFTAACTLIAGLSASYNSAVVNITIGREWFDVPPDHRRAFFVVACAHFATYASLILAGVVVCFLTLRTRSIEQFP